MQEKKVRRVSVVPTEGRFEIACYSQLKQWGITAPLLRKSEIGWTTLFPLGVLNTLHATNCTLNQLFNHKHMQIELVFTPQKLAKKKHYGSTRTSVSSTRTFNFRSLRKRSIQFHPM
jgi:hypothetical protein